MKFGDFQYGFTTGLLVNGCPSFFKIFENFDIIFGDIYNFIQIKEYRYQNHSFCVETHVLSNEIIRFSIKSLVFEKICIENTRIYINVSRFPKVGLAGVT